MKRIIKLLKKLTLWILSTFLLYFSAAWISSFILVNKHDNSSKTETIFLYSNGVHLDFILPNKYLSVEQLKSLNTPTSNFLSFGWGDRAFYLETPEWKDLKASTAIKAMFLPSKTAMHVNSISTFNHNWVPLKVSKQQRHLLTHYILSSFSVLENNSLAPINNIHYSPSDQFYEANGNYSLFNTCNEWVNNGLKSSGIKTSIWSPFDYGVLKHLNTYKN